VAEKDCPATRVTGPGRCLPPYHPPPPRVGRGDRAQQLRGLNAPAMTREWSCLRAGFCCGGPSACHLPARLEVRCAAEWRPLPSASRDAGEPPPLRCRRRHPFPRPTFPPPRQRSCTCPRARTRLWSRPACPVSMRRQARHRPEGQGIARTCLEFSENGCTVQYVCEKGWG